MSTHQKQGSRVVSIAGILGFVLGFLPLVALTFFSPGLRSEGARGLAVVALGVVTLVLLIQGVRGLALRAWLVYTLVNRLAATTIAI